MKRMPSKVAPEVKEQRKLACRGCSHKKIGFCALCRCPLAFKIPFAGQSCPISKW